MERAGFRPISSFLFDSSETPWLGVVLGSPIIGLWYWCTDQYIVQRVLTARNLPQARRGSIWAGYLKLFPVFIFLIPGMIAVALKHNGVEGFADMERPDEAFPRLAAHLLPQGLRGLVLAGMLAALMSSLASLFNSTATLFTVDFYERLRPKASEAHLVNVGRAATVAVVVAGIAWIPIMQRIGGGQLYGYLQNVQSLLAPAIAAVFMLGIFSKYVVAHLGARRHRVRLRHRHGAPAHAGGARDGRRGVRRDAVVRRHQLALLLLPVVRAHLRA